MHSIWLCGGKAGLYQDHDRNKRKRRISTTDLDPRSVWQLCRPYVSLPYVVGQADSSAEKILTQLRGVEWDEFADLVKAQLVLLKRFSYVKQIASVEKLLYHGLGAVDVRHDTNGHMLSAIDTSAAPTPLLISGDSQSPQSSSHPSTHANSIDATAGSRKSSGSNALGVLTPTST